MPGKKGKSGRKKMIPDQLDADNPESELSPEPKRKPGRPRKSSIEITDPITCTDTSDRDIIESQPKEIKKPLSRVSTNIARLNSRNSDLNKFYDNYIGPALEQIPKKNLPLKRTILQRYRALRSTSHNMAHRTVASIINKEVMDLWDFSAIPRKDSEACLHLIQSVISHWVNSKQDEKTSKLYQDNLNTLLDLRPSSCSSLPALKKELQRLVGDNWEEDYQFFKGQLKYPQDGFISPTSDQITEAKRKKREERESKTNVYKEKNSIRIDTELDTTRNVTIPYHMQISEENIVPRRKRMTATRLSFSVDSSEDEEEVITEEEGEDWQLPVLASRKLRQRPAEITLTLPARELPSILARTSTVTKTSARHELKIVSTLVNAGDGDLNDISLSKSTIHRQRKSSIQSDASKRRENLKTFEFSGSSKFFVFHWDGKIIQYITGKTEDRLAVAVSAPNFIPGQFLASPAISDGKGLTMANAVYKVADDYGLVSLIEAMVFDTTASNTGKWKGSVTKFEKMLDRKLLWLACRHHIPELFIKHASIAVRGPTDAPTDPLFKDFKTDFDFIDLEKRTLWNWPVDQNDWRFQRASEVLEWATMHMEIATFPREDYRELIELVTVFLGGVVKRVRNGVTVPLDNPPIRKPGAIHRARFMASCLFLLKIFLYQKQYKTSRENISHVKVLAEYVALLHAPYFLKSPLAVSAPRQDRDFWVDVRDYQKCFEENEVQYTMLNEVLKSVLNHLWYLTEELVIFGLFDDNLGDEERKDMATKLLSSPHPIIHKAAKSVFPNKELLTDNPTLERFVGSGSWLFFDKVNASGDWLTDEVHNWATHEEYCQMLDILKDLKVVNDLAERCIKDIEEYADITKDSQYREDILLVVSDHIFLMFFCYFTSK